MAHKIPWYVCKNLIEVLSPSLIVYPARVRDNIRRMIAIAGNLERLRPHIKTHKMPEVLRMQMGQGITRFKCATIAEAEMAGACGAVDVLIAYPPVGPNVQRMIELVKSFPGTKFSAIVDDATSIRILAKSLAEAHETLETLLDIDCGQHRTGIAPGPKAVELYRLLAASRGLTPGGLHAYDGHIHDSDPAARARHCEEAFAAVSRLRQDLVNTGLPVPRVVAGGTPTFPMHARRGDVECSPGTCVFWDAGYGARFADLDFLPAAVVLTRVVSKPGPNHLCLDLGHKSIASEMPHPRVQLLNLPDAQAVAHSEEHLVVETARANEFAVGDCLYGVPWHICPTIALHSEAVAVEDSRTTQRWRIAGRERRLTI